MSTLRQLIEARIRARVPDFREVAGSANLNAVAQNRISTPGCYVFIERESASGNFSLSQHLQEVDTTIGVIVVVRNVANAKGQDADDERQRLCDAIRDALIGWQPDAHYDGLNFTAGALVSFANGFLYYKLSFATATIIGS